MKEYIQGRALGVWTVSMMTKTVYSKQIPEWLLEAPITDLAIKLFCAHHGKVGYIPDVTAVYRRRTTGSWSELSKSYQWQIDHMIGRNSTYNLFEEYSESKYKKEIQVTNKWWREYYLIRAYRYANRGQRKELIFDNLDYFLNLSHKGNLSRWIRFVFGDRFVSILKRRFKIAIIGFLKYFL